MPAQASRNWQKCSRISLRLEKRLSTSSTSSRAGSVISKSQKVRKPGISQQWELLHEPAWIFATHGCYRSCGIGGFLQSNLFYGEDSVESDYPRSIPGNDR